MSDTRHDTRPSMADRIAEWNVRMTATEVAERPAALRWNGHRDSRHYRVTLSCDGRRMVIYYSMGPAHTEGPTLPGVLDCLVSDARSGAESFEDFCSELGFDEDSRTAERTWKACARTDDALRRVFGDERVELLTYETERE